MAHGLKFARATKPRFDLCALSQVIQTYIPTMITKTPNTRTPNTRKKLRRLKRQMQLIKALDDITPNKQVGKWDDLRKMFTENKSRERQQLG